MVHRLSSTNRFSMRRQTARAHQGGGQKSNCGSSSTRMFCGFSITDKRIFMGGPCGLFTVLSQIIPVAVRGNRRQISFMQKPRPKEGPGLDDWNYRRIACFGEKVLITGCRRFDELDPANGKAVFPVFIPHCIATFIH